MILIQSTDFDVSTTDVIRWLCKNNAEFNRFNNDFKIISLKCLNNNYVLELENATIIDAKEIYTYWYRRGDTMINTPLKLTKNKKFDKEQYRWNYLDNKRLLDYLVYFLKNKINSINDYFSSNHLNKLIVLDKADIVGLDVPKYIITTQKKDLELFLKEHKFVITKAIDNPFTVKLNNYWLSTYTEKITQDIVDNLQDSFHLTFFQQEIIKKFEIRSFYLKSKFYSMAIFSQTDEQTKTDFRHYNDDKPNRTVPFKLPENIEIKLLALMRELELESGSIDIIYGTDDKFYFLEVNPIGQFGMVSYPCNYNLEHEIAKELMKNE
ncbi:MAG: grasp-with-spasm system ATP-grasp peptide maturase [Bacteroidales bacterium]|jgi:ATP-GRASP peptide maturase of grasp-with-spasm system|nr:grasp-with-spasm system ATP-grasp peptide maturase [Bacteroidales bacterium]